MRRLHQGCALALLIAALGAAGGASAADPSAEDKERARTLLLDGRSKLQAGDAEGAVKAFQAAHAIMGVPTTGLDLARGLAAQGRLIEARAVALEVTRIPAAPKEPEAFANARVTAEKLAEALSARIPALVIAVKGPPAGAAQVMVDGTAVPAEALGLPWKVNPGEHVVAAAAAGHQAERRTVRVGEGEALQVEVVMVAEAGPAAGGPAAEENARRPTALGGSAPAPSVTEDEAGRVPTWAWVAGGAGLVALGVGTVFAIDYMSVRGKVAEDCPGDVCDPTRYNQAEADGLKSRWNRDLGLALGLGAVGLIGLGAAVVGVIAVPGERPSDSAARPRGIGVAPWIAGDGGGAFMQGRF